MLPTYCLLCNVSISYKDKGKCKCCDKFGVYDDGIVFFYSNYKIVYSPHTHISFCYYRTVVIDETYRGYQAEFVIDNEKFYKLDPRDWSEEIKTHPGLYQTVCESLLFL